MSQSIGVAVKTEQASLVHPLRRTKAQIAFRQTGGSGRRDTRTMKYIPVGKAVPLVHGRVSVGKKEFAASEGVPSKPEMKQCL